jgi:hypothetical protein
MKVHPLNEAAVAASRNAKKRNGAPRDGVALGGLFSKIPLKSPIKAVDDINAQHDVNPSGSTHNFPPVPNDGKGDRLTGMDGFAWHTLQSYHLLSWRRLMMFHLW